MTPGKITAQAGHAYLGAFARSDRELQEQYHGGFPESPGTKVCLAAQDDAELLALRDECQARNLPHCLVIDSGCQNFFAGAPTITALGVGPVTKQQAKPILGRFKLL